MNELFTQVLGLSPHWLVRSVDFQQPERTIHFAVECEAMRLPYSACGVAEQPIHDRIESIGVGHHYFAESRT